MILRQANSGTILRGTSVGDFLRWDGQGWIAAPGSSVVAPFQTDRFIGPGPDFVLSQLPAEPVNVQLYINGARYQQDAFVWTLAGMTATWTGLPFALEASDDVVFFYEV